jgi:hypothetical protein
MENEYYNYPLCIQKVLFEKDRVIFFNPGIGATHTFFRMAQMGVSNFNDEKTR